MRIYSPTSIERERGLNLQLRVPVVLFGVILILGNHAHDVDAFKPSTEKSLLTTELLSSKQKVSTSATCTLSSPGDTTDIDANKQKWVQIRGGASDDEHEDMSIVVKVFSLLGDTIMTIMSMVNSVFGSATQTDESESDEESFNGFGAYLSKAYGCFDDEYDDEEDNNSRVTIEGGSLTRALQKARSNARLLVAYIPASKPSKKKSYDQIAIQSILSSDVSAAAERKPRKKEKYGSFMFWATKIDSSEASAALKRLKVKPPKNSKKSPTLVVVYAAQTIDSSGRPKIVPRVLAQHHCNPPLSPESMSAWLSSLRKRHAKQYAGMYRDLREVAYMKEREMGYHSSMKEDKERADKERREEEKRVEEERIQKEKEAALKERRKSLLEALPKEPEAVGDGIITIALRFGDGRMGQRRFTDDTEVDVLFNWVDAVFELERERVILTTMNGQKSFSFGDDQSKTLQDSSLGRLVAFRVSEKEDEEEKEDDSKAESDEEDESDSDEE